MSRRITCGFEAKDVNTSPGTMLSVDCPENIDEAAGYAAFGSPTYDTAVKRSGLVSLKCASGASGVACYGRPIVQALATTDSLYIRAYFRFENLPSSSCRVLSTENNVVAIKLTSTGKFQLWNLITNAQVGSDSSETVTAGDGVWYMLEISFTKAASTNYSALAGRVNGTLLGSESFASTNVVGTPYPNMGWRDASVGNNLVLYVDDVAINDNVGSDQNTWPGEGKIVLLLPISNNSIGNWLSGSGTSGVNDGNQWDAINNTPPVGTATPNATTACISNKVSGAGGAGNGDFNMATYASAGIGAGDTITLVNMIISHGEDVSTGAKTGTFTVVSNPAQATPDNVGESSTQQFGWSVGGAVGTYNVNWTAQRGTVIYGPTVTVGSSPVCRITKTDTGTRSADVCFMGLVVEYVPAAPAADDLSTRMVDGQRAAFGMMAMSGG